MTVVKLELDRERALREAVRMKNYLERVPNPDPNVKAALNELAEKDGLIALLTNAPLVGAPPPPPPVEEETQPPPPPPLPDEHFGLPLLYEDRWPSLGSPFVGGSDNQSGAAVGGNRSVKIHLTGERYEFSGYKTAGSNSKPWRENDEYACSVGFTIGSDIVWGGAGHHCTMFQLSKGIGSGGGGSPVQSLELGDYGAGKGLYIHDGSYTKIATINPGQRYLLGIHDKMHHTNGFYTITLDGKQIAGKSGVPTMQPGNEAIYKFGLYGGGGTISFDHCAFYARV